VKGKMEGGWFDITCYPACIEQGNVREVPLALLLLYRNGRLEDVAAGIRGGSRIFSQLCCNDAYLADEIGMNDHLIGFKTWTDARIALVYSSSSVPTCALLDIPPNPIL